MTSTIPNEEVVKQDGRGRVRQSVERRERLLEEFDRSGASGAQFARLAGIKYSTFAAWVWKRRKKGGAQGTELCPRTPITGDVPGGGPIRLLEALVESDARHPVATHGLRIELPGGSRMVVESPVQMQMAAELVVLVAQRSRARC